MIICSTADDHLSPFIWTSHRSIAGDAYYAMGMITKEILQIKEEAGDEEVILLKAGDIFDTTTPDPHTEEILKMNMEVLLLKGIKIFSIQGNHEYHAKTARATLFGTTPLSAVPIKIDGVSFCGIDYTASSAELHEKVSMIPPCDYLVMHTPFRHLLGFADKYQIEASDIPAHIKNVIVGDIHKQHLLTNDQGVHILSPGSSHPRKIPEISEGHGLYVHKHEEGIKSGRYVNVTPREFYAVNIETQAALDNFKHMDVTWADRNLQPVIILQVMGEFYKQAVAIGEQKGALVVSKEILKIDESISIESISDAKIPTLEEALPKVVQKKQEPEVFALLEQLLTTKDPESVMEEHRNKFFKIKEAVV